MKLKSLAFVLVSTTVCLVAASPARAELAIFAGGNTMSIKAHHMDGDSLVLSLRSGGHIICEPSMVVRFAPDEVPSAEPQAEATAPLPKVNVLPEAVPFGEMIDSAAARHGVSAQLVRALIKVESDFQERALSPQGAMGLMQLMPDTARRFSVADPYNPRQNIEGGIKYLKFLLKRFSTTALALAAYNAGESAVDRFRGIPPYVETHNYVRRILRIAGQ